MQSLVILTHPPVFKISDFLFYYSSIKGTKNIFRNIMLSSANTEYSTAQFQNLKFSSSGSHNRNRDYPEPNRAIDQCSLASLSKIFFGGKKKKTITAPESSSDRRGCWMTPDMPMSFSTGGWFWIHCTFSIMNRIWIFFTLALHINSSKAKQSATLNPCSSFFAMIDRKRCVDSSRCIPQLKLLCKW